MFLFSGFSGTDNCFPDLYRFDFSTPLPPSFFHFGSTRHIYTQTYVYS